MEQDDFKAGTYNLETPFGLDFGPITLEPGAAIGLSEVFKDDPNVMAIDPKYFVFYFNLWIVIGKGMYGGVRFTRDP